MDPRHTDEYLVGTTQQINPRWSARGYGRYRYSTNFWEDTQNNAREQWAPAGYPKSLYIENLIPMLNQINGVTNSNNNAYIIAQLDGAFTRQYEATVETDWRGDRAFVKTGMEVRVELDQLPVGEFGSARARITRVSSEIAGQPEVEKALGAAAPPGVHFAVELVLLDDAVTQRLTSRLGSGTLLSVRMPLRKRRVIQLVFDPIRRALD
jgi:hypothetical protein